MPRDLALMGALSYEAVCDAVYLINGERVGGPFPRNVIKNLQRDVIDLDVLDAIPANCRECNVLAFVPGIGHTTTQVTLSRWAGSGSPMHVRVKCKVCGDVYAVELPKDTVWMAAANMTA